MKQTTEKDKRKEAALIAGGLTALGLLIREVKGDL
jgi:hypothetical protein